MNIQLEWTPNPNTLKYVVDRQLLPSGALSFTSPQAAEAKSPLAWKLMQVKGVTAVMLGANFVTVTKGEEGEWDELNEAVTALLEGHLQANEPVVNPGVLETREQGQGESEVERKIREILESEIRPALMMDGGDISFERFEDGVVYLYMRGSCSGCPSATMTLKMGIEQRLRESVPEVAEVVSL